MRLKLLIAGVLMVLCVSVCRAQIPAKKTDLTVVDREVWQKMLRWPVEFEEQWRRSRTNNDPDQGG